MLTYEGDKISTIFQIHNDLDVITPSQAEKKSFPLLILTERLPGMIALYPFCALPLVIDFLPAE
jgi:hypothetical protein